MNSVCHLVFKDFDRRIDLVNAPELAESFRDILVGWNIDISAGLSGRADMTFEKKSRYYDWQVASDGLTADKLFGKPRTICDAVCDFHYEAYRWYRETFSHHLCIHAAAVEIADCLVVFPNTFAAGKSTLALALAAEGMKIFGDDVVAVDTRSLEAISLGMMPRLRLPLPSQALNPNVAEFLNSHVGISGPRQRYIKLGRCSQAALGERWSIGGFVLLDRLSAKAPATIAEVGQADILKALIGQNFNTRMDVRTIFQCLKAVTLKPKAFRLSYGDLSNAISCLKEAFAP
jgi:hypothetical protein